MRLEHFDPPLVNPEMVRAMTTELLLAVLVIRVDSQKASYMQYSINLSRPVNGERVILEMSHASLTSSNGFLLAKPDLSIELTASDLEAILCGPGEAGG